MTFEQHREELKRPGDRNLGMMARWVVGNFNPQGQRWAKMRIFSLEGFEIETLADKPSAEQGSYEKL